MKEKQSEKFTIAEKNELRLKVEEPIDRVEKILTAPNAGPAHLTRDFQIVAAHAAGSTAGGADCCRSAFACDYRRRQQLRASVRGKE